MIGKLKSLDRADRAAYLTFIFSWSSRADQKDLI
jgi:hypothetical protein